MATSVDLVRDVVGPRPAGFVNAVLRRVAARDLEAWLEIAAPARADDPEGHLAVRYSHPRWIVSALREALGGSLAETEAALAADSERPAVTLCAVPGLAGSAELTAAGAGPGPVVRVRRLPARGRPGRDRGRRRGPGRASRTRPASSPPSR